MGIADEFWIASSALPNKPPRNDELFLIFVYAARRGIVPALFVR